MKTWFVRIPVYADFICTIEAETEADAMKQAEELHIGGVCHQCSDRFEIGDMDQSGEITVEEQQ